MINWGDVQRKANDQMLQNARAIYEINKGYLQREDSINGWNGGAGEILLRYTSRETYATFGRISNSTKVGP